MDSLTTIQNKILDIRGQKVILDYELAALYGVETKQLKRAVRRNIERFEGEDFMFTLTKDECSRYQIGTLNGGRGSNVKYLPFAFTEMGVAMLSSVLNSSVAIQINRGIMRAFVIMRQLVTEAKAAPLTQLEQKIDKLAVYVEDILKDQNDINEDMQMQLDNISEVIAELQAAQKISSTPRRRVGFITQSDKD